MGADERFADTRLNGEVRNAERSGLRAISAAERSSAARILAWWNDRQDAMRRWRPRSPYGGVKMCMCVCMLMPQLLIIKLLTPDELCPRLDMNGPQTLAPPSYV